MTTRRGFLGALAAACVLDPDRALWVPGKKLISIPKPAIAPLRNIELVHHWPGGVIFAETISLVEFKRRYPGNERYLFTGVIISCSDAKIIVR